MAIHVLEEADRCLQCKAISALVLVQEAGNAGGSSNSLPIILFLVVGAIAGGIGAYVAAKKRKEA